MIVIVMIGIVIVRIVSLSDDRDSDCERGRYGDGRECVRDDRDRNRDDS